MSDDVKAFEPAGAPSAAQPVSGGGTPSEVTVRLFEEAVRNHSRRLLAIARAVVGTRASPEDVVQQAITNLFQHRERYDWHEPGGLLKRAVVNEALRILRQPKMASVTVELPGRGREGAGEMIDGETVQRVRDAIAALPDHFRAALVLCEYEQMAYVQIAEVLGASVPQVKTWIHRARRQVGRTLKAYMDDERMPGKQKG